MPKARTARGNLETSFFPELYEPSRSALLLGTTSLAQNLVAVCDASLPERNRRTRDACQLKTLP